MAPTLPETSYLPSSQTTHTHHRLLPSFPSPPSAACSRKFWTAAPNDGYIQVHQAPEFVSALAQTFLCHSGWTHSALILLERFCSEYFIVSHTKQSPISCWLASTAIWSVSSNSKNSRFYPCTCTLSPPPGSWPSKSISLWTSIALALATIPLSSTPRFVLLASPSRSPASRALLTFIKKGSPGLALLIVSQPISVHRTCNPLTTMFRFLNKAETSVPVDIFDTLYHLLLLVQHFCMKVLIPITPSWYLASILLSLKWPQTTCPKHLNRSEFSDLQFCESEGSKQDERTCTDFARA